MAVSQDLLFGILSLQNGLIDQACLVAAFQAWTLDKTRSLADHLTAVGQLDAADRAGIEAMVVLHLKRHGGDADQSLASLAIGHSTHERLASLADPEIEASLSHVGAAVVTTDPDDDRTPTYKLSMGASGSQRFRVLRPHAKGGLGAVFVALDGELNREVALKQILEHHADDPASRHRFLIEAEITGGLEHPGIVPVYGLGSYESGRPYYAMRFIRGDSLKESIARFHRAEGSGAIPESGDDRRTARSVAFRGLLRRFLDVCNALDYAHSRGVLHRDLKPGNIIVGRYGETLVVDWGLAKATGKADPTANERTLMPSSASGSAETLPGSAVGTPAYMSPEQACGDLDKLGPSSDVYSLGATLYCLLCGKPPFDGDDLGEILRRVQIGEFPPPRHVDPAIDKALEAVCKKAMATQPDERYTSCQALAQDVERWLADEPVTAYREPPARRARRWARRNRIAVTAAIVALIAGVVGLGVVSAVQTKARNDLAAKNTALNDANTALDRQRQRAEDRESQAIEAVKHFRDAVAAEPALKNTPALEELRKRLLKEPLAFFRTLRDRLQAERDTRRESLVLLASACFELGYLTNEIGDPQDAVAAFRESLTISQTLAESQPSNAKYQTSLGHCQHNLGALLLSVGQLDEAKKALDAALTIRQAAARANPVVSDAQRDLASTHVYLGYLLNDTGRPIEAMKEHEASLAIFRTLVDANPTVIRFQRDLAGAHNNVAILQMNNGRSNEAMKEFEAALTIRKKLASASPGVAEIQSELASGYSNIGILLSATGRPIEALESFDKAVAVEQKLTDANPAVTQFQRALASNKGHIGRLFNDTGRPADALKAYEAGLEISRKLVEANPKVTQYQSDLASSYTGIGLLQSASGRQDDALKSFDKSLAITQTLADANPTVTKFQNEVALIHNNIGLALNSSGRPNEALKAYEKAVPIKERLAREHPESPEYASGLGATLNNMALLDLGAKRFEQASVRLRFAIECQKKALAVNPRNPTYRIFLASHLKNLIEAQQGLGREAEAAAALRELNQHMANDPRFAALDSRLSAVLKGEQPKTNGVRLGLARRAFDTERYAAAARLWAEALLADPKLANDRNLSVVYNAACAAALASAGMGKVNPSLVDAEKEKLRAQALVWLKADLAVWAKLADSAPPDARQVIIQTLKHWRQDSDLASIRDPGALSKLPENERKPCVALWTDVDDLIKRVEARKP